MGWVQTVVHTRFNVPLSGVLRGTVREVGAPGGVVRETFSGRGMLSPLGPSTVHGTVIVVGTAASGSLTIRSPQNTVSLRVQGPDAPGSPSVMTYDVRHGSGMLPSSPALYLDEVGSGTVNVSLAPGTNRAAFQLDVQRS